MNLVLTVRSELIICTKQHDYYTDLASSLTENASHLLQLLIIYSDINVLICRCW